MKIFNRHVVRVRLCFLLASLAIASTVASSRAQQPALTPQTRDDRVALYQALLDLTNPWTVMCVAAHPDDEDGTSLIVMRRKYGAHTVSLFSTFGEGGQNAIGPELYEELGAIRARETMAASEIQGSEPYFLGLRDFGFSKSRDETYQKWGHDEALRRMVWQIRKLRPDVIITNHSTTSNDHGHHQATARLVVEAFDAAADPTKFPEQLKDGVTTWQVQRLFVRQRGSQPPPADAQLVTIDPNERDPVRGTLFAEQALTALQKHATQGPWPKTFAEFTARFRAFSGQSGATGQMPLIRYRLEREAKSAGSLPKDSHNFVDGLRLSKETEAALTIATGPRRLTDFADEADQARGVVFFAGNHFEKLLMQKPPAVDERRLQEAYAKSRIALLKAMGISAILEGPEVIVPGQSTRFKITLASRKEFIVKTAGVRTSNSVHENRIELRCCPSPLTINAGKTVSTLFTYSAPPQLKFTVPHAEHLYEENVETLVAFVNAKIGLMPIEISAAKRIDVGPPVEIAEIDPPIYVFTPGSIDRPLKFRLRIVNHRGVPFTGNVATRDSTGKINESSAAVALRPGESREINVEARAVVRPPAGTAETSNNITFSIYSGGSIVTSREIATDYVHAAVKPGLRVAYIRGFDFSLPQALNALGVESRELSIDEVKAGDLSKYTSIIVDNRVYESQPELIAANQKLLDYANAGGNLIVFYHRIDEFNPNPQRNRPQLSPYKLILGNERITDENAPITFIEPGHPLLNSPNKLNQDDFKGWIQERGLYYPREWDPQFKALLQSNDPNEQPLKGGLLVADYGKGHYIYTSMVWYRQLRAGVPGAYRMLANMISYGGISRGLTQIHADSKPIS